jgi:hypothetical protein
MSRECPTSLGYRLLERSSRHQVRLRGDMVQAARFADLAIRAMRLRFNHVEGCERCLLAELEAEALA